MNKELTNASNISNTLNYIHKVNYYETDKMGIVHHSNYIRWMEEARVDFFDKIGYSYRKLEEEGIVSPVVGVECNYKFSTIFGEEINIETKVKSYDGVKLVLEYNMESLESKKIVAQGTSKHCFLDSKTNKIISLKKQKNEIDNKLRELL